MYTRTRSQYPEYTALFRTTRNLKGSGGCAKFESTTRPRALRPGRYPDRRVSTQFFVCSSRTPATPDRQLPPVTQLAAHTTVSTPAFVRRFCPRQSPRRRGEMEPDPRTRLFCRAARGPFVRRTMPDRRCELEVSTI